MKTMNDRAMEAGGGRSAPVDRASAHRWNRALLSVYYHGRRRQAPLSRHPRPTPIMPLEAAIEVVLDSRALGLLRLALADLCRTRAAEPSARLQDLMRKLAAGYGRLLGYPGRVTPGIVDEFDGIFRRGVRLDPETAYQQAIRRMKALETGTDLQLTGFSVETAP